MRVCPVLPMSVAVPVPVLIWYKLEVVPQSVPNKKAWAGEVKAARALKKITSRRRNFLIISSLNI
jgi:hypothetical protein